MVLFQKLWYYTKNYGTIIVKKIFWLGFFKLVSVVMDVGKNNSNKSGM